MSTDRLLAPLDGVGVIKLEYQLSVRAFTDHTS